MIKRLYGYLKQKKRLTEVVVSKGINKMNKGTHQLTNVTEMDRYPEIFKACATYAAEQQNQPKLLSFGCSTGEECLTLNSYMPEAAILGADIVKSNLRKAKQKVKNDRIKFFYSSDENLASNGPYDMIFCMSVLCRWTDTEIVDDCTEIYPFTRFEEMCQKLDQLVAPGGLLIIYNANFRFNDTSIFENYSVLPVEGIGHSGFVHRFDASNKKLQNDTHKDCVFIKNR